MLALLVGTQPEQQDCELTVDTTNTNLTLYVVPNDPASLHISSKHLEVLSQREVTP